MKKLLLLLLLNGYFSYCFSQDNPYAVFGYKPKVIFKDVTDDIYKVKNADPYSKIKSLEFDYQNHLIKLLDKKDSVIQSITVTDDKLLRFLSVDPITKKYPELTPYQFASNTPIQAIDLDGLEAFIIHGTNQTQTGVNFTTDAVFQFKRITGNKVSDDRFRWNAPIYNDSKMRTVAANQLVSYVVETRERMMSKDEISKDEPISLIGYSHGGNVVIQTAKILNDKYGTKVNLITIGTPAKNSAFGVNSTNWLFGNIEDPQGNPGINSHYHIRHVNDMVWKIADAAGDKSAPYYSNEDINRNWDIPNTSIKLDGSINSHTDLPFNPGLGGVLKKLPTMTPVPPAGILKDKE